MINNYLSPLEFRLHVKRMPDVEFFAQAATLPGLTTTPQETNNPYNAIQWKGEKTQYSSLDVSFIIDEDMDNWLAVHDWMVGTTSPQEASQFRRLKQSREGIYSDITLTILSSKKNRNVEFTYVKAFPYALSPVNLDTRTHDVQHPYATVSFAYDYYTIRQRVGENDTP